MRTYLLETNVGMHGSTHLRVWDYRSERKHGCDSVTSGPGSLAEVPARSFLIQIERPAQYPLYVAMGEPGRGVSGMDRHRWHALTVAGYWQAAGARVTWPKSLAASQRRYWSRIGADAYRRVNNRQYMRADERAPMRNETL